MQDSAQSTGDVFDRALARANQSSAPAGGGDAFDRAALRLMPKAKQQPPTPAVAAPKQATPATITPPPAAPPPATSAAPAPSPAQPVAAPAPPANSQPNATLQAVRDAAGSASKGIGAFFQRIGEGTVGAASAAGRGIVNAGDAVTRSATDVFDRAATRLADVGASGAASASRAGSDIFDRAAAKVAGTTASAAAAANGIAAKATSLANKSGTSTVAAPQTEKIDSDFSKPPAVFPDIGPESIKKLAQQSRPVTDEEMESVRAKLGNAVRKEDVRIAYDSSVGDTNVLGYVMAKRLPAIVFVSPTDKAPFSDTLPHEFTHVWQNLTGKYTHTLSEAHAYAVGGGDNPYVTSQELKDMWSKDVRSTPVASSRAMGEGAFLDSVRQRYRKGGPSPDQDAAARLGATRGLKSVVESNGRLKQEVPDTSR